MARSVTLGNGKFLVGLDARGQVRDLYYPFVGHSNHVSGASGTYTHRIGVWVEGRLKWLGDDSWTIDPRCTTGAEKSIITARNESLGVLLTINDVVHNERDVFLRRITVENLDASEREIRLFFGQEFRISESRRGDTSFFDPRVHAILHYKGHNTFLINAHAEGKDTFDDYSVGIFGIEGKAGTFTDAEDGELSKNTIEHGSTDSVIGVHTKVGPHASTKIEYWIAAAETITEAHNLDTYIREETVDRLIDSTEKYWHAWMSKESKDLRVLPEEMGALYLRSLSIIRVHCDDRGGIIASSDSDMLNQGRDSYSYVWPRDAALTAYALDRAGYYNTTQRFFKFITGLIEPGGYLMHKYRVDGVLGSSWHPWFRDGKMELPIQEDETALVLFTLWQHYSRARDLEFIESIYNPFIEPASDFLVQYIEPETGLPSSSYDLWEEKYGTSTYTSAAVYGALSAASEFATILGKREKARVYRDTAERVREGILGHLYDPDQKMFVKLVTHSEGKLLYDRILDTSSFHGISFFGVLPPEDRRLVEALETIHERLVVKGEYGGYMRYEEDSYYRTSPNVSPNAWCITTLWVAQYYIKKAKTKRDLMVAEDILWWCVNSATENGVLPEQLHPQTGAHLSTSPLVWSHSEYVITVDAYLRRLASFNT